MQSNYTWGLALLLTLVSTSFFGYCSFIGLNFWVRGALWISVPIAIALVVVLIVCMAIMIKTKGQRNARVGRVWEFYASIIIIVVIGCATPFFTKFCKIYDYDKSGRFEATTTKIVASVKEINKDYKSYAENRINNIPEKYKNSLERRLIPNSYDDTAEKRDVWLKSINKPNIWNIFTPSNIYHLQLAAEQWAKEYTDISRTIYEMEDAEVYQCPQIENNFGEFNAIFTELHWPDIRGVGAALACLLFVFLTYFATRRSKVGYSSL